ncbi:hypothetical protein QQF64_025912 [Cirrhinus molitorella]|uniref:Uncharacterized protein n=1 Tax=Cirrhinus molitorella TaxID=172907 RepID=A0ABR3NQE1_9TELE
MNYRPLQAYLPLYYQCSNCWEIGNTAGALLSKASDTSTPGFQSAAQTLRRHQDKQHQKLLQEQTDDVTYTEVTVTGKKRAKKNKVRCDDLVAYASIRGAEAEAQENCSQLYASVNKSHHKSDK